MHTKRLANSNQKMLLFANSKKIVVSVITVLKTRTDKIIDSMRKKIDSFMSTR
jgi:hypothetical protein